MNNNSSRFGKFLELVFNTDGLVMGGTYVAIYITCYIRMVEQQILLLWGDCAYRCSGWAYISFLPPKSQLQGVFIGEVSCGLPGKRGEELSYLLPDVCWTLSGGESPVEVGYSQQTQVVPQAYLEPLSSSPTQLVSLCFNLSRCLVGSGTALEGAVTPEAGNRFQEIRDSLQAIGFSKEVCTVFHHVVVVFIVSSNCTKTWSMWLTIILPPPLPLRCLLSSLLVIIVEHAL